MTVNTVVPTSAYTDFDRERWAPEPPKSRSRSTFERDRARVLHSFALRRLAAKTQVVQPGASDFPRTRLTHSLECAQIGRELGQGLGCDPDLVEAACLAHDLGHPPFGHNGETALDVAARSCGGFEGNAQSLRLLTRLEGKVATADGRSAGLNLTRATLDATLKYPWERGCGPRTHKFNAYADDADVFAWAREGAPAGRSCFEAQIMDWADDVAYSVHDLEDGLYAGLISLDALHSPVERVEVVAMAAKRYCDADPAELSEVFEHLLTRSFWPASYDGDLTSLAALKNLTSQLIGRFCRAAEQATRAAYGPEPLTRYAAELVVPRRQLLECALLKALAAHYVMARSEAQAYQAREREVIAELVSAIRLGAPATLDTPFRADYAAARDDAAALRVVIDQVSALTDTSALAWHARLLS
ncbi:deoxyguanosinetriphosphate triphosphohydrolase [Nocardiopsis ansamitocini]|uniref:Deoxyguanosinetriphosphate triphosphohydrolase-like protein n=1 Tax=Nocardiopsis ansamitocini TaxID=1670832 RepID=A0A9W6UH76_9ACTN|nr:deoxyguanosinetriphosphate triphosphohydrolase [Nocardiopsis ansamitocini]GLU46339.1 deoxyguanosinetriphosphate triphosphohydrolase-like protein [Nocardiopsis ansamitocini]